MKPEHKLDSLNDAIRYLAGDLGETALEWSDNALVIGTPDRYAKLTLASSGYADQWTMLLVQIMVNDKRATSYTIRFTLPEYAPPRSEWSNPDLEAHQGGHIWQSIHDLGWYVWRPHNKEVSKKLEALLKFHQIKVQP